MDQQISLISSITDMLLLFVGMQYCEYGPEPAKCYEWMKENLPDYYARLVGGGMHHYSFYTTVTVQVHMSYKTIL